MTCRCQAQPLLLVLLFTLGTVAALAEEAVPSVAPAETPPPPTPPPPPASTTAAPTTTVTSTTAANVTGSRNASLGRALGANTNISGSAADNMTSSLQDLSLDDIDMSMLTTTLPSTECPPGGGTFTHGCDELCECLPGSTMPVCHPRCSGPMFRRGRSKTAEDDPLCDEKPVDDCCAVLVCQDSAVEPIEGCLHNNITLQRGEVYKNGCEDICNCADAGKLICKPRCPVMTKQNSTMSDKCVTLPDPSDPCCTVVRCDVTLSDAEFEPTPTTTVVSSKQPYSANKTMEEFNSTSAEFGNMNSTCNYKGKSYKMNEEFHDGCEAFCVCGMDGIQCAKIECPTDFGLDLIDPHCLDWDTSSFVPTPPFCCPAEAVCKNNGSCLFQGQRFNNFVEIPSSLTGCEKQCVCEYGNVTCRQICVPLGDSPPAELRCPVPAIIGQLPHDTCCKTWLCPQQTSVNPTVQWNLHDGSQGHNEILAAHPGLQHPVSQDPRRPSNVPISSKDQGVIHREKQGLPALAANVPQIPLDVPVVHQVPKLKQFQHRPPHPNPLQIPEEFLYHLQGPSPDTLYNMPIQQNGLPPSHSQTRRPPTTPEELLARLHQQSLLSDSRNHSGFGVDNLPPGFPRVPTQQPGEVVIHVVEAVDSTSVRLVFSVPPVLVGLHGRIELRYTSDKRNNDISTWEQQILAPPEDIIATPQLEFVLGELQPNSEYRIQISVMMRDLQNAPRSPVISIRTPPPALPPVIETDPALNVVDVNATWIELTWRKFTDYESQFIDGIQLRYKEVNDKVYAATPLIHRSVQTYRLDNLRPSSQYEIAIFFIPFPGQTTELQATDGLLVTTAALQDPYHFELEVDVSQLKAKSVEIEWKGVPYPPDKYVNVFRAVYQSDAGKEDFSSFKVAKRDAPPKALILDLKPGTRYRLWLEAYLTNGKIKKSNVKDFITKPASVIAEEGMQGKLEGVPTDSVQTANSYYSPLVAVAVLAALAILAAIILLLILLRKNGQNKAAISAGRKSQSAYDNPSYKTCENDTAANGNSTVTTEAA